MFCLVWVADIAAYFGGRAFGKRKLAPTISPGKSWEGVFSGMAGVLVLAFVCAGSVDASQPVDAPASTAAWLPPGAWPAMLAGSLLLGRDERGRRPVRIAGQARRRRQGQQQLLPGHGGVLDRVDALLPVFLIAIALASMSAP